MGESKFKTKFEQAYYDEFSVTGVSVSGFTVYGFSVHGDSEHGFFLGIS